MRRCFRRGVVCTALAFLCLSAAPVFAAQLTLAWDANTDPGIAGYRLAYGTSSGTYTTTIDVGNVTTYTVTGLTAGQQYYFVAYAYNTGNLVSPPSQEVSGAPPCTSSVTSTQLAFAATGGSGSATVTAGACGWTATSNVSWLTITSGTSGSGNGTVTYTIAANFLTTQRTATLTVGGQTLTVTESGEVFSGAGQADLLWLNDTSRQVTVWYLGGAQGNVFQGWSFLASNGMPGWTIVGTGDFDGDGHPDLIWQNESTRQILVWYMGGPQGNTMLGSSWLSSNGVPGWSIVAVGDFNGDGQPDVVWQNDSSRQVTVWYMGGAQGTTLLGFNWLSSTGVPGWHIAGVGDFNGDGHPDVIWQNDSTRQVTVWYMGGTQGTTLLGWSWLSSGGVPGWSVAGSADFNADGHPDLVWQNDATRQVTVWYMGGVQGNTFLGWNWLSSGGVPGWTAIAR